MKNARRKQNADVYFALGRYSYYTDTYVAG